MSKKKLKKKKLLRLLSYVLPFVKDVEIEKENQNGIITNEYTKWKVREQYDNNVSLPSKLLSSGTVLTTATIVALFFSKRKIQFFEEPERGVHPAVISALYSAILRSQQKQTNFFNHT
ncbi:MAG: ATP-binding protein [Saprospiraceae bacterium]|nr:ATP-binding protein [Saprospiraceae bacterium]